MIVETATVITWLKAGAAIAAGAAVKEATKDAYAGLKAKLIELVGGKASDAFSKLEKDPGSAQATADLETDLSKLDVAKRAQLAGALAAVAKAFEGDEHARATASQKGHVVFDLDAEGHITLARIKGASMLDVKARTREGDISISDIEMREEPKSGN